MSALVHNLSMNSVQGLFFFLHPLPVLAVAYRITVQVAILHGLRQFQMNSNELHLFTLEASVAPPQALASELDGNDLKNPTKTEARGPKHILYLTV